MNDQHTLEQATELAMEAGNILLRLFEQPHQQTQKTTAADFATEVDEEAEAYLTGELLKRFPAHHIVGEEGGGTGAAVTFVLARHQAGGD